jgi:hypothetical protein
MKYVLLPNIIIFFIFSGKSGKCGYQDGWDNLMCLHIQVKDNQGIMVFTRGNGIKRPF